MVERDIEQHADSRAIKRDRTVAFIDLADIDRLPADHRAGERAFVRHEVLHHCAVHDRRLAAQRVENPAQHRGHGRFAAGPGDPDPGTAGIEQDRVELGAGEAQQAEFVGAPDFGHIVLDRGGSDQDLRGACDTAAVLREKRVTLAFERGEFFRRAALIEAAV